MSEKEKIWLPLFPLQLVLFPGEELPLHIFEERYRSMIRRCEADSTPFGVVLVRDGKLSSIGCMANIDRTLQTYPDGRSEILVRGAVRFRANSFREHEDGYVEGQIDLLDDVDSTPDPQMAQALFDIFGQFRKVQQEMGDFPVTGVETELPAPPSNQENTRYTFYLGALCPLSVEERQSMLEIRSEKEREEVLMRYLVRAIPKIRRLRGDQIRIRGNGRPQRDS